MPKGTSIRRVDDFIIQTMREYADWEEYVGVGTEGDNVPSGVGDRANNVLPYNQELQFSLPIRSFANNVTSQNEMESTIGAVESYSLDLDAVTSFEEYRTIFSEYPCEKQPPYRRLPGWTVSILKKDGTWDIVKNAFENVSSITFSTREIDTLRVGEYARSSDGSLRCKVTHCRYAMDSPIFAKYFLLDFLPQKANLGSTRYFTLPAAAQTTRLMTSRARSAGDANYADVKVSFKNMEGTEHLTAEILEEGATVPFKYNIDNCIKGGSFVVDLDRESKTKVCLLSTNQNGTVRSDTLQVEISKPINIYIKTLTGKKIPLVVYRDETVADVKRKLQDKEGVPID